MTPLFSTETFVDTDKGFISTELLRTITLNRNADEEDKTNIMVYELSGATRQK